MLFLPENEIHELGLMYLNYEVQRSGYKTIFLGESVPISSAKDMKKYFDNIIFVCYMTVEPNKSELNNYIREVHKELLDDNSELWAIGRMVDNIDPKLINNNLKTFTSINELVEKL